MGSLFRHGERHGNVCFGVEEVAAGWTWAMARERRGLGCPESPQPSSPPNQPGFPNQPVFGFSQPLESPSGRAF